MSRSIATRKQQPPAERSPGRQVPRVLALALALAALITVCGITRTVPAWASEGEGCPNEALRAELNSSLLPECRAYEMVTPSYKDGYAMNANELSSNGEKAIIRSLATVAGIPGEGETVTGGGIYLDTRTPSGWKLSSMNPPQSEFAGQLPVEQEADDGESLWIQHKLDEPSGAADLYLRTAEGHFTPIGPLDSTSATEEGSDVLNTAVPYLQPIGTTSDYQHIILKQGFQAPLYEYGGTNNTSPLLVEVYGKKGSTDRISECGGYLGGFPEGSSYNALSSKGEVVFFTVYAKNEYACSASALAPAYPAIFARIDGSAVSSSEAETVEISESECSSVCGAEESGKNFEGASENGKLVYFTSTQKLTNDAVDGTTSGDATLNDGCSETLTGDGGCNLYEYDFEKPKGQRLSLVAGGEVAGVAGISEDGSYVYFVSKAMIASAASSPSGGGPQAGQPNLYVYEASSGSTSFIATLAEGDFADWERALFNHPVEVAGEDGQFMLFESSASNVTPDDHPVHAPLAQIFEYKAEADGEPAELVRVTQGEDGFAENGNDVSTGVEPEKSILPARYVFGGAGEDLKTTENPRSISENGETVFFSTAGQLSSRATSATSSVMAGGCLSVYEFHAPGGVLSKGAVRLVSDGQDVQLFKGAYCGAQFEKMDAKGTDVLFSTGDPLLSGDVDNGQRDLYDARLDGGFALPAGISACGPGVCEGPPIETQPPPAAVSASDPGEATLPSVSSRPASVVKRGGGKPKKKHASPRRKCRSSRKGHPVSCRQKNVRTKSKVIRSGSGRGK
jgi:hypothetical protein